ncbi:MAG: prepilin-type N-terminal cleavage/methylation domain-containing protein [Parasphingorhabdus sp.]|uniref:prepilin-type N-terminal cleavage/methylation domain-containing protein n=1 Tax=Parasphingorhabdus sp. TaxID=2709688 RepID=UPI003296CAD2
MAKHIVYSVDSKNGFTLVEVLVALVVTAFLITILMDGAVSSKTRQKNLTLQTDAMMVAASKIESLRDLQGVQPSVNGNHRNLVWNLAENEIARDPRGVYALVEARITVGPEKSPMLVTRKKRYLKSIIR